MAGSGSTKLFCQAGRLCAFGLILLAGISAGIPGNAAAANTAAVERAVSEYEVKAAYVYNFAKFVDWPRDIFPAKNTPIYIGVIGDEDFAALLGKVVKDKLIQEHSIHVRLVKWPTDLRTCNMVYVGVSEHKRFRQIAESLQDSPVLTITEAEDRAKTKGIMNLFIEGGKVQFEVNITDAEKAKLRISSKLLRLAHGTVGSYSRQGD